MQKQRGQFQSTPCQKSRKEIEIKRNQDFFSLSAIKTCWAEITGGGGGGGGTDIYIVKLYKNITK